MRSTQDPIRGLERYIEEWGVATAEELKVRFRRPHTLLLLTFVFPALPENRQGGQGDRRQGRRGGQGVARARARRSLDRHLLQGHRTAVHARTRARGGAPLLIGWADALSCRGDGSVGCLV